MRAAPKQDYLDFANNLPNILAAFEMSTDRENEEMREAFKVFKEMAGTAGHNSPLIHSPKMKFEARQEGIADSGSGIGTGKG